MSDISEPDPESFAAGVKRAQLDMIDARIMAAAEADDERAFIAHAILRVGDLIAEGALRIALALDAASSAYCELLRSSIEIAERLNARAAEEDNDPPN